MVQSLSLTDEDMERWSTLYLCMYKFADFNRFTPARDVIPVGSHHEVIE